MLSDLGERERAKFAKHIEPWDETAGQILDRDALRGTNVSSFALRVEFTARYDPDEDEFKHRTCFRSPPVSPEQDPPRITKRQKQDIGYMYLRSWRTGSRAASLQRGSLLDVLLRVSSASRTRPCSASSGAPGRGCPARTFNVSLLATASGRAMA